MTYLKLTIYGFDLNYSKRKGCVLLSANVRVTLFTPVTLTGFQEICALFYVSLQLCYSIILLTSTAPVQLQVVIYYILFKNAYSINLNNMCTIYFFLFRINFVSNTDLNHYC